MTMYCYRWSWVTLGELLINLSKVEIPKKHGLHGKTTGFIEAVKQ